MLLFILLSLLVLLTGALVVMVVYRKTKEEHDELL